MRAIGEGFGAVDEVANGSGRHADYLRTATGIEAIADGKRARDRLLGIGEGAALLEVGCGLGDDARRLAALVGPAGRVVGLDASTALLERARSTPSPVEWVAGDVQALPFADATFDAARTERTLQHVADPDAAVAEMARVVRPGGVVLACEPDWATVAVSGVPSEVADALRAGGESSIRHPRVGRALPGLLVGAGLRDVQVAAESVGTGDFALFSAMTDLPAVGARASEDGALAPGVLDRAIARMQADAQAGRFLAILTLVTFWGRV
jgi:SAM-dependent methyltransferase